MYTNEMTAGFLVEIHNAFSIPDSLQLVNMKEQVLKGKKFTHVVSSPKRMWMRPEDAISLPFNDEVTKAIQEAFHSAKPPMKSKLQYNFIFYNFTLLQGFLYHPHDLKHRQQFHADKKNVRERLENGERM